MEQILSIGGWVFVITGVGFFVTGSLGLMRFPDLFTRLHAVTKADTAGLGLLAIGLGMLSGSVVDSLLLLLVWVLVMASSAINCQLLARYNCEQQDEDPSLARLNEERDGGTAA